MRINYNKNKIKDINKLINSLESIKIKIKN